MDGSRLEPFERTRAEIEFVSGLLVGGAAQARGVIDAVGASSRQRFLLADLKRLRPPPASACECRQPYALLARVVVNDVVGPGAHSSAATVADTASSTWTKLQTPWPAPMIATCCRRTCSPISPAFVYQVPGP